MRVPQISERVKEAPAQALRGVFAGIGQLLLVTDKLRNKTPAGAGVPRTRAPQASGPAAASAAATAPASAAATAPAPAAATAPAPAAATAPAEPATAPEPTAESSPVADPPPAAAATPDVVVAEVVVAEASVAEEPVAVAAVVAEPAVADAPDADAAVAPEAVAPEAVAAEPVAAEPVAAEPVAAKRAPAKAARTARKSAAKPPARDFDKTGNVRLLAGQEDADAAASDVPAVPSETTPLPLPNYDELSIASLRARLRNLDIPQLKQVADYERAHAGRAEVIAMFERRAAKLEAEPEAGA